MKRLHAGFLSVVVLVALAPSAHAFPGRNGAIVYGWTSSTDGGGIQGGIWMRPVDYKGGLLLYGCKVDTFDTPAAQDCLRAHNRDPSVSADGRRIVRRRSCPRRHEHRRQQLPRAPGTRRRRWAASVVANREVDRLRQARGERVERMGLRRARQARAKTRQRKRAGMVDAQLDRICACWGHRQDPARRERAAASPCTWRIARLVTARNAARLFGQRRCVRDGCRWSARAQGRELRHF